MTTFLGTDIDIEIRQLVNDSDKSKFDDSAIIVNINASIRALFRDAPAFSYSTPIAFSDSAEITALANTINIDVYWKEALIYHAAARCLSENTRDTKDIERSDALMTKYRSAL